MQEQTLERRRKQKQTSLSPTEKKRRFQENQGKVGENWALIVQQEQRGSESRGACGRRACLLRGAGVSGHWLTGGSPRLRARLLQRRVLASLLENLSLDKAGSGRWMRLRAA